MLWDAAAALGKQSFLFFLRPICDILKKANNRYDVAVKNAIRKISNSSVAGSSNETVNSSASDTVVAPQLAPRLNGRVR